MTDLEIELTKALNKARDSLTWTMAKMEYFTHPSKKDELYEYLEVVETNVVLPVDKLLRVVDPECKIK
jgi:hypothetical protein